MGRESEQLKDAGYGGGTEHVAEQHAAAGFSSPKPKRVRKPAAKKAAKVKAAVRRKPVKK